MLSQTIRADDYYGFNNGQGGSGTWQDGGTALWYDFNQGTANNLWNNTTPQLAYFGNGGSGTVNVVGNVTVGPMEFNGSGDYTITGSPGATITHDTTSGGQVLQNDTTNNVTVDPNLLLDVATNSDRWNIGGYGSGTITINGNISYINSAAPTPPPVSYRTLIFNTNIQGNAFNPHGAGPTFVLNGNLSDGAGVSAGIRMGEGVTDNSKLFLNGDYTGMSGGIGIAQGTVILGTSKLGSGNIGTYNGGVGYTSDFDGNNPADVHSILTAGAQTITNMLSLSNRDDSRQITGLVTVGSYTDATLPAANSTFSGQVNTDFTDLAVTAAAGSRVNFTGSASTNGSITGDTPSGLIKTGTGTVVLSGSNTYYMYNYYNSTAGTVAADLQAGTTLINNTTGSAFGNNQGLVNVEAGARLGGSGTSAQKVVVAAGGTIAPGDSGADLGTAAIATLHLTGGLSSTGGATLAFKLDGNNPNDMIDLGAGTLTLNGTVNLVFSGPVTTGHYGDTHFYQLMTGTGNWSASNPTFDVTAPAGYVAIHTVFDTVGGQQELAVEFSAVPEPSTWAMMLGGLATLITLQLRKRRTV